MKIRTFAAIAAVFAVCAATALAGASFNPTTTIGTVPDEASATAVADLDRDGDLDIVAVNRTTGALQAWRNDGTPFNGSWVVTTLATDPLLAQYGATPDFWDGLRSVDVADLDGDGWMDIVTGSSVVYPAPPAYLQAYHGYVSVWRNDGTPFTGSWTGNLVASDLEGMSQVVASDLDLNGKPDLVVAGTAYGGPGNVDVLRNSGTPFDGLPWVVTPVDTGSSIGAVGVHDLDADGYPDIVYGKYEYGTYRAMSDGTPFVGGWGVSLVGSHGGGMSGDYAFADFDGNGEVDIVAACGLLPSNLQAVFFQSGGLFTWSWFGDASIWQVAVADLDGNGSMDIVSGDNPGNIVAWDGTSPLSAPWPSVPLGSNPGATVRDVTTGDLDCDLDPDVIAPVAVGTSSELQIWENTQIVKAPIGLALANDTVVEGNQPTKTVVHVTLTLSRPNDTCNPVTVRLWDAKGLFYPSLMPTPDKDYRVTYKGHKVDAPVVVTWNRGEQVQIVDVTVIGDRIDENTEDIDLRIDTPVGVTISDNNAEVTITDDDTSMFAVRDARVDEGNPGRAAPRKVGLEVSLDNPSAFTTTIAWSTAPGSAHEVSDYLATSGVLTFMPGVTKLKVPVTIVPDKVKEGSETFTVQLGSPTGGAGIADDVAVVTIHDDD